MNDAENHPGEAAGRPAGGPAGAAPASDAGPFPGTGVVRASLGGTGVLTVLGAAAAAVPDVLTGPYVAVSLLMFLGGTVAFVLAFLRAVDRSRTEAIGVGGLFFAAGGSAPPRVARALNLSLAVEVVVSITVASIHLYTPLAFGVLAPMWALGLTGLWVAAHGTFPSRTPEPTRAALRDADRRAHRAGSPERPKPTE